MRFYFCKTITVSLLLLFQMPAAASEFKLYLDDSRTKHIMVEKQDCSVYKSENGKITLGFKAGNLFFGIPIPAVEAVTTTFLTFSVFATSRIFFSICNGVSKIECLALTLNMFCS